MSSISDRNGSDQSLAYREYWRDDRDRIRAWKRGSGGGVNGMEDGRGDRYDYDDEGQLTAASYRVATPEGTPGTALRTDVFNYDALGNRMGGSNRVASRGQVNFTRRNNGLNQYLDWTPSAIFYDDNFGSPWVFPGNGVTMADGWITASYNALNQPMAMWSPTYGPSTFLWFGYDPLGRCVKRWTGTVTGVPVGSNPTTYFYYDGWNLVQEGFSATVAERSYVHGGRVDEIVASKVAGLWYNHHYDARGHCMMLTTSTGGLQEQYDYDAFGYPYFYTASGGKMGSGVAHTRFLFTGREWLRDLMIYDYRARQYQPELGRFLQPDPKEFDAGDYNLYRYCHNDPVNNNDPFGLELAGADMKATETPGLFDDKGKEMFGRTTYGMAAGVGTGVANGKFYLQIVLYHVTVLKGEISTTKNGEARTRDAMDATRQLHEPLHDKHTEEYQNRMLGKVLLSGLAKRPTEERKQRELAKLRSAFDSFNRREQGECMKGQGAWKSIIAKEEAR